MQPDISLIIPVFNEEACIVSTVEEVVEVLSASEHSFEVLVINDGSTDGTAAHLRALAARFDVLRVLALTPNSGQSAAFGVGFKASRGRVVVLMDGDGQNDPHDVPALVAELDRVDVCCGYRARRQDTWSKRIGSRLANAVRRRMLNDGIRDTGCSLKAFRRECVDGLPMELCGMHRFLPALVLMREASIHQIPVNHRPRAGGVSKYTNFGRLLKTVGDVRAVRWMQTRYRRFEVHEVEEGT